MSTTKDDHNQPAAPSLLTRLYWSLGLPIIIAVISSVITLLLEYKSGFFLEPSPSNWLSWASSSFLVPFIAAAMLASIILAIYGFSVWLRQRQYMREHFSLIALWTTSLLTLVLLASLLSGFMPWSIHTVLLQAFSANSISQPDRQLPESFLLMALFIIYMFILFQQHQSWRGLKSLKQYQREQRSETTNFFLEGLGELRRLSQHRPPLQVYTAINPKQFVPQLEPVTDSLAWKDQAKELIRLSSSSYAFDPDSGWHDKENCWVGQNVNTGDLVFVRPHLGDFGDVELRELLAYVKRVTEVEKKKAGEIIVATKSNTANLSETPTRMRIRCETEANLLNNLVDFKDYFNEIKRRVLISHLPDSDLTLRDVYVPSQFLSPNNATCDCSIEEQLLNWLNEPGQRQLALLGEYGQGKSTAALMWTYHLILQNANALGRTPLLIELRGTSPLNMNPLQLLGAWAAQYNINPQALMRLQIAGRLILIFEGFDEMALVGDAEMRLKHFRTLWQFAYPGAKVLITGRPNFFLDEEEMKAALGISKPLGDRPYCEALRLMPFNSDQVKMALRAYKPTVRHQIHALVEKNQRFQELVSRPSLLHIVAVLWEREQLFEKVDQLTSAFVMDLFIRYSYRRQGLKEQDTPKFMALTTLEREYFMTGIATYMATHRLPNQITNSQLNEAISDLIDCIPESVSIDSSAISGETTKPLRTRIQAAEFGVEHVKTDVRTCGLLVDDPVSPGTFRFGHKSFMEYLFAAVVAERIQDTNSEKALAIFKATNAEIENLLLFPVAIEFLSELLVSLSDAKEAEYAVRELSIAKRLFRAVMSDGAGRIYIFRPAAFIEILMHSITRRSPYFRRRIVRELSPILMMALLLSFLGILLLEVSRLRHEAVTPNDMSTIIWLSLGMMLGLVSYLSILIMGSVRVVRRKLQLWNRICRELGIHDKSLHQTIGTSILPWVGEQPFDYCTFDEVPPP